VSLVVVSQSPVGLRVDLDVPLVVRTHAKVLVLPHSRSGSRGGHWDPYPTHLFKARFD